MSEKVEHLISVLDVAVYKGAGSMAMEHWFADVDDAITLLNESRRGEKLDFDRTTAAGVEMAY